MAGEATGETSETWRRLVQLARRRQRRRLLVVWGGFVITPILLGALVAPPDLAKFLLGVACFVSALLLVALVGRRVRPTLAFVLIDALDGLESERLLLRRARPGDADGLAATADDDVQAINGWPPDGVARLRNSVDDELVRLAQASVVLVDRATGHIRGSLAVNAAHREQGTCELGWWLGPDSRRQGYGTEALTVVLPVLHAAGAREVHVGTGADNTAVQHIVKRLDFRSRANRPHRLPDGRTIDSLWFVHSSEG